MPDNQSKRQQGIESLLAERKKYEAWLTQLETRRASTAEHVFSRVHTDYAKRLDDVRERLGAEADGIKSLVADLEGRLATEQRLVTEKTDERAELELRATVGEFSEKEWSNTRGRLDGAIAEIRSRFDTTERELAEMRETLSSVTAVPAAEAAPAQASAPARPSVTVDAALASAAAAEPEVAAAPPPVAAPAPEPAAPVEPRARTPFDELAFLKSVAGTPTTPTPMPAVPVVPAPPASAVVAGEPEPERVPDPEVVAELEPEPEPAPETASEQPLSADPDLEASYDMTHAPVFDSEPDAEPAAEPEPARRSGRQSSKTPAPEASFGAPTPRTSQAIRSLKCQECGTLNFPTEWYCERCGGELAAF